MEKIYGMHKLVGLQLFWSGAPTFSSGTPTFCQMGVLNSCFQNPSESSDQNKALCIFRLPVICVVCLILYNIKPFYVPATNLNCGGHFSSFCFGYR